MTIFISPLIKGYDLFAIIEGYVFYILFVCFLNKKRGMKMSKLTVPLIKGNDLFAIIEGHVFMTIYKKEESMFLTRTLLKISRSTYVLFKVIPHKSLTRIM